MDSYLLLYPSQVRGYSFRKRWMTTILTSVDGTEQRSALFTWPRRSLVFSTVGVNFEQINYFKRNLFSGIPSVWGIPYWQDRTTLTHPASAGHKILKVVSTLHRNFEVGAFCILLKWTSPFQLPIYEVEEIKALSSNEIELVGALGRSWDSGTSVYPLLKSRLGQEQVVENIDGGYNDIGTLSVEAMEDFDEGVERSVPNVSTFQVYKDHLVFPFKPKRDTLGAGFFHPYDYVSFLGRSYSESLWAETAVRPRADMAVSGRDRIRAYLDFFDYHQGRFKKFWLPTGQRDLVVVQPFASTDDTIRLDLSACLAQRQIWKDTAVGRYIALRWPDGSLVCSKIVEWNCPYLVLEASIGKDSPSNLRDLIVSFLLMVRFDIDEIEINYLLEELGVMSLYFRSLPLETPE